MATGHTSMLAIMMSGAGAAHIGAGDVHVAHASIVQVAEALGHLKCHLLTPARPQHVSRGNASLAVNMQAICC